MLTIRAIIPENPLNATELTNAITASLDEAAAGIKQDFEATVETWNEKPEFQIWSEEGRRAIFTENQIYDWVNNGTAPHEILPIRAQALRFMINSSPKTSYGKLSSTSGNPGDQEVLRRRVFHPGVFPRFFDLAVQTKWWELLPKIMQAKINAAIK